MDSNQASPRFRIQSYQLGFRTGHPEAEPTRNLCPSITLYEDAGGSTKSYHLIVHFWNTEAELRAATMNNKEIQAHFHERWYERILSGLKSKEICFCQYKKDDVAWVTLDGDLLLPSA